MMYSQEETKVSIVIPCRNEEKHIAKCLQSIIDNSYPKNNLEVLVCDGLSTDGTRDTVHHFDYRYPYIKLLTNDEKTTQHALNLGAKASQGDIIIILGAHSEIASDYIASCVSALDLDEQIGCVGGLLENVYENKSSEIISNAMSSVFGVGNAHFRLGSKQGYVDTVAFGAYKREVFNDIGYFDEELVRNQDDEFNYRLVQAGFRIYLSRNIRAKYYVRSSYKKLMQQYYQYGYWKVLVNKKHHTITTVRQVIPFLFVSFIGISGVLSFVSSSVLSLLVATMVVYTMLAGFFAYRATSSLSNIPLVVYSFLILHLGYGVGYLEGLLRFIIFNRRPKETGVSFRR